MLNRVRDIPTEHNPTIRGDCYLIIKIQSVKYKIKVKPNKLVDHLPPLPAQELLSEPQ